MSSGYDISPVAAGFVSCLFPLLFSGTLYIWPGAFKLTDEERNTPVRIKQRWISVAITCVCSFLICLYLYQPFPSYLAVLEDIGFRLNLVEQLVYSLTSLLSILILFFGPLYAEATRKDQTKPFQHYIDIWEDIKKGDLQTWRNVIIGPVAEEFVFRGCMCSLLLGAGWTPLATIVGSPLLFGLAHFHHLAIKHPAEVVFQFAYTTLFGWIAAYYFVRTRYVLGAVLAHMFCNATGLPDLSLIGRAPRPSLIIVTYVLGLVAFFFTAPILTSPLF